MNLTQWILLAGIALANNLDNTGVGIAYGLARIRISHAVNAWIAAITFVITGSSVFLGDVIGRFLPPYAEKAVSATILCIIGGAMIRAAWASKAVKCSSSDAPPKRSVLSVLQNPQSADADGSRHIDFREGALLGVALSINNMGGGFSAGLIHLSILWTAALSAAISFTVIWLGSLLALRPISGRLAERAPVLAGALLIAVGLLQFR